MNDTIDKTKIQAIKIDQNRVEKASEELDMLFEVAENSLIIQKNEALSKHSMSGNFDEWKKAKALDREQLIKNVAISKKNIAKAVNNALVRTIVGVNQTIEELSPELVNQVGKTKVFELANNALNLTVDKLMSDYDRSVATVYKLRNHAKLYEAIREQSNQGLDKGVKIVYRNGRKMSFKSYMEMNIRTTVRQEANEFLFKASKNNRVVVYISSYFGDSADDHKNYQRKYYYDKDWRSFGYNEETTKKIEALINRYKMVSYQSVVYEPPYLTTRPNCRHTLRPVPLDDFFSSSPNKTAEDYGMSKGTYKTDNYKKLQEQRRNERMIRKYKTRLINDRKMQQNMNSPEMAEQIRQDHLLIAGWEARQRRLIKANPILKRDYRRENNKVIVQDAGARYHMGMDIKDNKIFFMADKNGNPLPPMTPAQAVAKAKI